MATIADLQVVIGATIDDFEAKMARVQSGIGRVGDYAKSAGQSLSTYVTLPLTVLAGASIAALAKIDGLTRGLNAISTIDLGKQGITGLAAVSQAATATSERLKLLQDIARAPGIGFEQAVQGDIRLRAVGIAASQSAAVLKEFANAIALTGGGAGKLDEVTVQLAQLSAKGKVLAQDLRPIIEAAPAVATALQKLYGTVDSETISKSLEKQGKSSKDFITVLTDELGKLPRVTGGIGNSLDNFSQGATQSLAKLGDALNKAFNVDANINRLSDFITNLADSFATLSPGVQKAVFVLAGLAAAAGPVLFAIGTLGVAIPALTAGFALLAPVAAAAWVAVTGPIGLTVLGLTAVAAGVVAVINHFGSVKQAAAAFGEVVSNLVAKGLNALSKGLEVTGFPIFAALAGLAADKVAELAARLGLIATPVQALSGTFAAAFRAVPDYFSDVDEAVVKTAGLLAKLEEQLKAAKEGRPALTNEADITGSNRLIASLEAQIKRLNELGIASQQMRDAYAAVQKSLLDVVRENRALGDVYDLIAGKQAALEAGVKSLVDAGFSPFSREVRNLVLQLQQVPALLGAIKPLELQKNIAVKTTTSELPEGLGFSKKISKEDPFFKLLTDKEARTALFTQRITGLFGTLGEGLAAASAGIAGSLGDALGAILVNGASVGDGLQAVFGGVLSALSGFMSSFGQQLITIGIGKLALDSIFSGPQGGPLAIAAGVGLVALAGVVGAVGKSAASSLGSIGSGGGGGSLASSPRSSFTPSTAPNITAPGRPTTITHNVVFELSGNKLLAGIEIEQDRLGRVRGK